MVGRIRTCAHSRGGVYATSPAPRLSGRVSPTPCHRQFNRAGLDRHRGTHPVSRRPENHTGHTVQSRRWAFAHATTRDDASRDSSSAPSVHSVGPDEPLLFVDLEVTTTPPLPRERRCGRRRRCLASAALRPADVQQADRLRRARPARPAVPSAARPEPGTTEAFKLSNVPSMVSSQTSPQSALGSSHQSPW